MKIHERAKQYLLNKGYPLNDDNSVRIFNGYMQGARDERDVHEDFWSWIDEHYYRTERGWETSKGWDMEVVCSSTKDLYQIFLKEQI